MERAQMYTADMESYLLNKEVDADEMKFVENASARLVREIEQMGDKEPLSKEKTILLLGMMKDIKKANESLKYDKITLEKELNAIAHKNETIQSFVDKAVPQQKTNLNIIRYYQTFVTRFIKQTKFFD